MPLLAVRDLVTTLAVGDATLRPVDGVSFSIDRLETIGIVGESGAGKSVLVKSIMGLLPRSARVEGDVVFDGQPIREMSSVKRRHLWGAQIAMIFQDPMTSLNPVRKVGKQITDPIRYHLGVSSRQASARARELLELMQIPDAGRRLAQYPHELSGGMRQRVGIAIALSCGPKLLIADEPTTALDVTVQREILDLLASIQAELEMAMILITHDLAVVSGRTNRILVMYAGQIVEVAPTATFFDGPGHPYSAALLETASRLDEQSHVRLPTIPGRPPNLVALEPGCRFAPRCAHVRDRCRTDEPPLELCKGGLHQRACWYPLGMNEAAADESGV